MARRKASDKKVTAKKNRTANEEINNVQADQYSIAIKELHVGRDVGGDIRIGHTIGYTAEQVSVLLKQITTTLQPKQFDGRCPYKGLEVFEEEDAELFFGRERLVTELVGRVKESRTVFITGPSGSGKSSLVRAGLIHALKQGKIKSSERWLYETMKPGREPIKDLALAFSRLKSPELEDYFLKHAGETDILNKCAESVLSGRKDQRFLLFVDQFEEVFTQINQETERIAFINMLAHAGTVENGRVIVLFAMRSDFVSNCATYPALNELLSQEFRQIGAMQPEELVSAMALPARHVGLPIEDELIARIINDMKGEPGALPLMQFALKDLFDSQQAKGGIIALTLAGYLKHGGIHKSLERHADATFAKLSEREQELARSIFSGLIEIGRGTQDTNRTALFDELIPANVNAEEVLAIVQKLADARLIITDEQAGKDTVTLAHEKLIDAWPWLKKLVNENRDVIALQNEIAADAKEWDDHQRDASYLYSGARLANAREHLEAKRMVLSDLSQNFIDSSQEAEETEKREEEQRRQKEVEDARKLAEAETKRAEIEKQRAEEQTRSTANLRKRSLYLTIALVIAIVSVGVAVWFSVESRKQANIALARQLAAQAQSAYTTRSSNQMIAALISIQSMKLFPTDDAATFLLNNNFAAQPVTRITYDDSVSALALSPNGKYVVSGGCEKLDTHHNCIQHMAHVWEAATGKEVARMIHDDWVSSVAFSPDSKYVVSGGCEKLDAHHNCTQATARVWEAATGKEVAHITHDGYILSVVFSPNGKYVFSGGCDRKGADGRCIQGTARVWEADTGKEVTHMTHNDEVTTIAFSPDGKYVVSGGCDELETDDSWCKKSSARVWEVNTGTEVTRMSHDDYLSAVAFSPDGKFVVSSDWDGVARVWEVNTGSEVARTIHDVGVYAVAFSPDGKYVVSGGCDEWGGTMDCTPGTVRIWEATTGKEIAHMIHDGSVTSVAFSPDGKYVVSGSEDSTARVWEVNTGTEVARMTHSYSVHTVAFGPDGRYVVSGSQDGTVRVWEVNSGTEVAHMIHDGTTTSVTFGPDGKYVISSKNFGSVQIWQMAIGEEATHIIYDDSFASVALSPDGNYVVSGGCDDWNANGYCIQGTVRLWEATSGKEVTHITHDSPVNGVAFSPDSKYVVWGGCEKQDATSGTNPDCIQGTVRLWEVATGEELIHITPDDWVYEVAFSPDGKYLVSGSIYGTVQIWTIDTGQEQSHMTHDGTVRSVAFSPDGKYVVSGSVDNTARLWKASTGTEVARIIHDSAVTSVTFSSDGKYLVSGSEDFTARVWEVNTGTEVARLIHDGAVTWVAFSPDHKYVISGNMDSIRLWMWQPKDLIFDACARMPRNLTRAEWQQYIGDVLSYQAICENLPIEPKPEFSPVP